MGALLFIVSFFLSQTKLAAYVQPIAYSVLAGWSSRYHSANEYPVRVIDISDLLAQNGTALPTPGDALIELLKQVGTKLQPPPSAVGIDINMGFHSISDDPTLDDSIGPVPIPKQHEAVFRFLANRHGGYPIYLGVSNPGIDPDYALVPPGADGDLPAIGKQLAPYVTCLDTFNYPLIVPLFARRDPRKLPLPSLGAALAKTLVGPDAFKEGVLHALLKDRLEDKSRLPLGWSSDFAYVDFSILNHWDELVYRAKASPTRADKSGYVGWQMKLPNEVLAGLNDSLASFRLQNQPYVLLIGTGNSIDRSDLALGTHDELPSIQRSEYLVNHGTVTNDSLDFFIGRADPYGVPMQGSVFPGIAAHAALVATIYRSPVTRTSESVGLVIDVLLFVCYRGVIRWLDRVAKKKHQNTGDADHKGRRTPLLVRRLVRFMLLLIPAGLAFVGCRFFGHYWDGWLLVSMFMILEDYVEEPFEEWLERAKPPKRHADIAEETSTKGRKEIEVTPVEEVTT